MSMWHWHATQPTGSASHKQKNWDNVGIELRKAVLLANCNNDRDRARILATRARHAGAWLNALPISSCGLRMSNDVIRAAVGFRLGCRLCEPHSCRCGALVDAYGTHSLACNRKCCSRTPTTSSFDQWHHLQISSQSQHSFQQRTIGAVPIRRQKTGWSHLDPMAGWKVPHLGRNITRYSSRFSHQRYVTESWCRCRTSCQSKNR